MPLNNLRIIAAARDHSSRELSRVQSRRLETAICQTNETKGDNEAGVRVRDRVVREVSSVNRTVGELFLVYGIIQQILGNSRVNYDRATHGAQGRPTNFFAPSPQQEIV